MFVCQLGLEVIVSKKLNAPYKSGPSKAWLKIKNPKAPAATRDVLTHIRPGARHGPLPN
jgi:ATP-dependent DNA ligase